MRSLTPTEIHVAHTSGVVEGSIAGRATIDPEGDVLYFGVERITDGVVEVDILSFERESSSQPHVVASFSTPVRAPFEIPRYRSEILNLHYFSDDRSLVLIMAGGDIATMDISTVAPDVQAGALPVEAEVVGSVDSGIKAAAWSPDEEHLILVTGEDNLVCMTRLFDLVHEETLRSEDFGEDEFVNVGWGSKSTQFHGSLGKAAARAPTSDPSSSSSCRPSSLSHPTDDGLPQITFRGDAAFFAISSLDTYSSHPNDSFARRQIRVYSRPSGSEPKLSATSESLPGLEAAISWRPSGNLISSLVRYGYEGGAPGNEGRWEVAMLERNGLRHGGFPLREGMEVWREGRVRGMEWNSDSEVLAIWIERENHDVVQLWTMKNYHYYLKQEIYTQEANSKRFKGIFWHPEKALDLFLQGESSIQARTFVWDTYTSHLSMPNDTASVAVVDGDRLLITPFRTQNTPPPMSSYKLTLPSTPTHVSFSTFTDSVSILYPDCSVQVWDLDTRIPDPKTTSKLRGGGKVANPTLRWETSSSEVELGDKAAAKVITFGGTAVAYLLDSTEDEGGSRIVWLSLDTGRIVHSEVMPYKVERLLWSQEAGWLFLNENGELEPIDLPFVASSKAEDDVPEPSTSVQLSPHPLSIAVISDVIVHLSSSGKLVVASTASGSTHNLSNGVTSFTHTDEFLIYTTASQVSYYAPVSTLKRLLEGDQVDDWETQWETRAIERGALAVTACQSSMSLVLQMPRGSLETVYPRPLVLTVVRRDILSGKYREAFVACRKHRLDLNLLHDLDPETFMASLDKLVEQIAEVDYLNLFVSSLRDDLTSLDLFPDLRTRASSSRAPHGKLNNICHALRTTLEGRDLVKYTETILSTYVCQQPPDYEGGLSVLLQLQKDHPEIVEDAVKYIIFLSNVNQLYDVALGMYDFQLVLMVAQYSQKDPQEYLPFLKELRALDEWERKFRVDDHLARHDKALRHLHSAGPEKFDEAIEYVGKFELYETAFELYGADEKSLRIVREMYGDYLLDRRDYRDAALAYMLASSPEKAMKAYERAHAYSDLLTLAVSREADSDTISGLVERASDYLATHGRHVEAAQLMLDYTKDVEGAVSVLCTGNDFSEALRIVSLYKREDLIERFIHPGLEEAQEAFLEAFEEMEEQLDKEIKRIHDLRLVRAEDPDGFYMVDSDPALEGVDVATNATTAATAFTRYTVAPTTAFSQSTRRTGRTDKSRNRASRKRAAGRKGTVDEFEYLILSLGRLFTRLDEKCNESLKLLRHLVLASSDLKELASELQERIITFRDKFQASLEDAWTDRRDILREATESGGMGYDEGKGINAAWEVVKPVVKRWTGVGNLVR